jgi:hypothetical protein
MQCLSSSLPLLVSRASSSVLSVHYTQINNSEDRYHLTTDPLFAITFPDSH